MNRKTLVAVVLFVLTAGAVHAAWGYDYEAKQRPLWRTVSVDRGANCTDVFVHSQPYTPCGPDGTKNPIYRLRLLYVTSGESYRIVTAMPRGADYRVRVLTQSVKGESDKRLQERIAKEAKGDYSLTPYGYGGNERDVEILDASTARYESDRVLVAAFVVTRFRGYDDDEQRYVMKGKPNPKRLFNEFIKVEIPLPEHEYRYLWVPEGKLESKSSAWVTNPESDENLQLESLIQATFETQPLQQVRGRSIPEAIRMYCAHGLLWEGSWGEAGKIHDPYSKPEDVNLLYQKLTNEQGDTYYEGIIPKGDGNAIYLDNSNTNSNTNNAGVDVSNNIGISNDNIGISNNNAAASNAGN
jgi:hypothetical protein